MTEQHRATPEQWAHVEECGTHSSSSLSPCILELRDRLTALERMYETQRLATLEWGKDVDKLKHWIDLHLHRIEALESAANLRQQDEDAERAMEPASAGVRTFTVVATQTAGGGPPVKALEVQPTVAEEHQDNPDQLIALDNAPEMSDEEAFDLYHDHAPWEPESEPDCARRIYRAGWDAAMSTNTASNLAQTRTSPEGGSLVERVANEISTGRHSDARAAILAVAAWLRANTDLTHGPRAAQWLEQEVERHD